MVDVTYVPRKQIIIHEYAKYNDVKDLIRDVFGVPPVGQVHAPYLKWVGGIVLTFNVLPPTTEVMVKEILDGRIHWDYLAFAPLEKYQPKIIMEDGTIWIVADVSNNEVFRRVAEYVRKNFL